MRKTLIISTLGLAACLALTTAFLPKVQAAPAKTAQSVMVNVDTQASNFIITGTDVWAYDVACARGHFDNTLTSGPVISCNGNPANCAAGNQPPAPTAPAPDPTKLNGKVGCNSCNFWEGTALSLDCGGQNIYTQTLTRNGLNGSGNWTFEWTYTIGVGSDPSVAMECWNLQSSNTTQAELAFDVGIFSQSEVENGRNGRKASFTILDSFGASRVVGLHYSVTNANDEEVASGDLTDTVTSECNNTGGSFYDVIYIANAGSNGVLTLLRDNQTIGTILNGDDFANNNTDVAGACANVEKSTASASGIPLDEGSYTLTITGTVKGVGTLLNNNFSVTSQLCVSAGTCSVCP